ncbi:hypothetical protein EYC80_006101 [Monilinia laxa]|uniref:Uncharacterized protein n=1 Tax=Monilinia laxa TaxID=61186 RepID=A0A5N6KG46_MONLA|nr:hypothetical protein EYC80_006101 [Monilinia laxa]
MLVLLILPFRSNTFLEKMVIRFEGELRSWCNIVLQRIILDNAKAKADTQRLSILYTYIDTPELLNRVKSDNFLQEIIPVVALHESMSVQSLRMGGG